jgi:hypothetical protein
MTEAQLREIFPDGRTLHIPSNGRVLSQEGYQVAQAEWERCHRVPCNAGASMNGGAVQVADGNRPRTLWDMITGGGNNGQQAAQQPAPVAVAAAPAQAPAQPAPAAPVAVAAAPAQQAGAQPPAPPARPADLISGTMVADAPAVPETIPFQVIDAAEMTRQVAMADTGELDDAPLPPSMSRALAELRAETPSAYAPTGGGSLQIAAIQEAPVPQPRPQFTPAVTAAIDPQAAAPDVQLRSGFDAAAQEASSGQASDLDGFAALFETAVLPADQAEGIDVATENALGTITVAEGTLFAPELGSVTDTLMAPAALSSDHFAFEGRSTAAGMVGEEIVAATGFTRTASVGQSSGSFGPAQTIWVHYDPRAN